MSIPFLYPIGLGPDTAAAGSLTLPANGGSVAIPFDLGSGLLQGTKITARTTDTTGTHTLDLIFVVDGGDDGPPCRLVLPVQTATFTATVAANRVFTMVPGFSLQDVSGLWLVVRNTGAATTTLAAQAAAQLGVNICATATLAASTTAAILAATWVGNANCPLARIDGGIFSFAGATL
jgi:hypothetical protein